MSSFPQGSFFGVDLMGTSLNAFQEAENVTSNNIANVNTPGASRQVAQLNEFAPISGSTGYAAHVSGTFGEGVVVQQIQRIHSNSYDTLFRAASSSQNYYTVEQNALQAFQSTLGDPNSGIGTQFTAFQSAVNQLVTQAGGGSSTSARANVITQAQALASALNNAANTVLQQKSQVLAQGSAIVTQVNGILDQIAALNGQIRASTAVGDNPNTFADQRDQLINKLSQYLSTQTAIQPDGSTLVTVNGQALVNDTVAYHLAAPTIGTASNGSPIFKINFATTPPAAGTAPGIPLGSGQLAGLQDLYNNKLTVYGQQLDQFASSMANEVDRVTQAGYDQNGQAGVGLFQPIVGSLPISAGNIKVGITDPSQLPAALASTAAGTLVVPMNSANNTVDTSAQIDGNTSLANPPAGPLTGTLTVTVDNVAQIFNYNTGVGHNADTINAFITNFNAAHLGVTASFNASSQSIVFARDPVNTDLVHRAAQGTNPTTPTFTISDSNYSGATPAASLLGALGANAISGVQQNAGNAFAANDNSNANALNQVFSSNVGVPALETTSGLVAVLVGGTPTTVSLPAGVNNVAVGQVLTIDAQPGGVPPQENVVVSAVSFTGGIESVTFTPVNAHAAGFSIASAQVQTLGQFYGQLITQVGLDTQTAITGTQTQTNLANNINATRQSIDGINIDEETQNLIKYQNAYQAAAQTINVLNQLLNTVINNLGVGQ
ncbi:MAG: flagellar hook-associated protein FlgK [Vulcanimicrobiaceae bacterium]